MALNSVIMSGTNSNAKWQTLYLEFWVSSQSVANNTTTFGYKAYAKSNISNGSAWTQVGTYSISGAYSTSASNQTWSWNYTTTQIIAEGTFTKTHNSDGTLANQTLSITADLGGGSIKGTVSVTLGVSTIPRTSSLGTLTGNQIGSEMTIAISRANSNFTHRLSYKLPNQTYQPISTSATTSASFTIPLSSCSFLPNATSGTLTISCDTYHGTSFIGSVTKTFTVHVPSGVIPSFTSLSHAEQNSTVASVVGAYVQNRSTIKFTINGASGIYGSTIRSYSISFNGVSSNTTTLSRVPNTSGNITAKGTITDSRGRSASRSVTLNVLAYSNPKINSVAFRRSNSAGTIDPNGTYVRVDINASVSSLMNGTQKNYLNRVVQSRQTGGSWVNKANTNHELTYNTYQVLSGYSQDYSYDFRVNITDALGQVSSVLGMVPTGEVLMHWSRKTVAFGKMIDDVNYNVLVGSKGMKVDGPIYDKNGVEIYGAESGSNANGRYIKFSDGTLIFYTSVEGDNGQNEVLKALTPPISFATDAEARLSVGTIGGIYEMTDTGSLANLRPLSVHRITATSATSYTVYFESGTVGSTRRLRVNIMMIGRWK